MQTPSIISLKTLVDCMKSILIAFVSILVLVNIVYAHMEGASVDEMMNSMMTEENVSDINQLNCSKIPSEEFEELGEAVMEKMIGNSELHEQMDSMMGGESSESLRQMHVTMGKNWLGCDGSQGMMGGMMMPMMRMMGNYYPAYYSSYNTAFIFAVVGWILFLATIVILILVYTGSIKIRKRR